MNYQKIYDSLIDRARTRKLKDYFDKHHIIPKCVGGSDDPENIVELTYREHYCAHMLLVKIYPESPGLKYALSFFKVVSGCMYPYIRIKIIDALRQREFSDETKTKMSLSQLNRFKQPGSKDYLHNRISSDETRKIQSEARKKYLALNGISDMLVNLKLSRELNGPSMLGKNHSIQSKNKMRDTWRDKGKPILKYDGTYTRYEYGSDASMEYGIQSSNIYACAKKNLKRNGKPINKSLGFGWLYDTEEAKEIFKSRL